MNAPQLVAEMKGDNKNNKYFAEKLPRRLLRLGASFPFQKIFVVVVSLKSAFSFFGSYFYFHGHL